MKKAILGAVAVMAMSSMALAASNLNGTWVRDAANSDANPYPFYWVTRVQPGGGGGGGQAPSITVVEDGTTFKVSDSTRNRPERVYTLDGQTHTERTDTGLQDATVTATLSGDTLSVVKDMPIGGMPGNVNEKSTQTWSLSPDGNTLTITTEQASPARTRTIKEVYQKQR